MENLSLYMYIGFIFQGMEKLYYREKGFKDIAQDFTHIINTVLLY